MENYATEQIRNVALLSHGGAGKTSLAEAILFTAGAINRLGRVEEGTTTSDYDPDEVKRKISISLSLLLCPWGNTKLNIIDTPGYADFVGEVKAALRVADGAVLVICAASGVEVGTTQIWDYLEAHSLPRLIFINKMDRENADFYRVVQQIQSQFGSRCVPIQIPIGSQREFAGVVDLTTLKIHGSEKAGTPSLPQEADGYHEKLIEAVVEKDDELLNRYLEGETITEEELRVALRKGVKEGSLVPILVGAALPNMAISPLMDALCDLLPSPKEGAQPSATNPTTGEVESLVPEAGAPLAALVFKTTADPYIGKLTYFRLYSGTIHSDSQVWNSPKNRGERIGQLFMLRGKTQLSAPFLVAGDIGAVAKLAETSTGDTLCGPDHPLRLPGIEFPVPTFNIAVYPKTKADLDKMGTTLARLTEEDPTLRLHREADTAETILSGLGETHVDVAVERMRRKFGVEVVTEIPKIAYKETITIPVKAEYKHKKQTGGHGQYGHVFLELVPLPRGSGFEFTEKVVGGVVPKNYIPGVEKGVLEARQEGVLAHYPVVDVRATLYDGSYHPVDSSDIAFKIAGAHALTKGLSQGQPILLEPIMNIQIRVPENLTGDIMGNLNTKRGKVLGTSPEDGVTVIEAQVPQAEILRYATELRSLTQGRGTYTMEFSHYEEVPAHIAQKVIDQAKKEREKD
ncbi:MAG: elongation factor G [Chloroflexi bacterium]|nr:elongation factor G [Chloroflexota bacterium]